MEIHSVILFISSTSQACYRLIQLCNDNDLPVRFVRLDTQKQRQIASSGSRFQIRGVPTLVIQYLDGNTQLFTGEIKATEWITNFIKQNQEVPEPVDTVVDFEEVPDPAPKRRNRPNKKQKLETEIIEFGDSDNEDDIEIIDTPKKPNTESLMTGKRGKDSNMKSIFEIAKTMEQDRKQTLPYDEKDIPSGI